MITLREGSPPTAAPELWWIGKEIECPHCHWMGQLEHSDLPRIQSIYERNGTVRMVAMRCPTAGCNKPVKLQEELANGEWTKSLLAQSRSNPQQ